MRNVRRSGRVMRAILILLLGLGSVAHATLTMPKIFNDYMVLQREKPVKVWGWCAPVDTVTVTFAGQVKQAVADASGRWIVVLDPMEASFENRTMTISTALGDSRSITHILVGEVWLSSGQSNMNWSIAKCQPDNVAIATGDNLPFLRLFFIKCDQRYPDSSGDFHFEVEPQDDLPDTLNPAPQWIYANGDLYGVPSLNQFSGPAYFFARQLQLKLGVPVGMIDSSLGGSSIEPWIAPEGLATEPLEWDYYLDRLDPVGSGLQMGHLNGEVGLYETFIYPIRGFAMRGMIWHQGESSANCLLYENQFRALINGWRIVWGDPELYAGVGQLYPYTPGGERWPPTSWGQYRAGQRIPRAGSIVLNDHGNLDDIHPRNKYATGKRFAAWALSEVYEQGNLPQGPHPRKARWDAANNRIVIDFDYVGEGLHLNSGTAPEEFRVRCADDNVYPCTGQISPDQTQVWLTCPEITGSNPALMVEHAWQSSSDTPNVVNSDDHPLTLCKIAVREDFTTATVVEQDAQVNTAFQADLTENVTEAYFFDDSFTFRLVGAPAWLSVSEDGMLYGTPGNGDLGLNTCTVELDDGDGRVVQAPLQINVVPVGSPLMIGWERGAFGSPDRKVAGADAVFHAALYLNGMNSQQYAPAGFSQDGTWGSQAVNPPARTKGLFIKIEHSAEFSITNNTGADMVLDGIYFDYISTFGNMTSMEMRYAEGDLADATNTLVFSSAITAGAWANYDAPLSGALSDLTLANGEHATFRLTFYTANSWSSCYMDNAMIRFITAGTSGNLPPVFPVRVVETAVATEDSPYTASLAGSAVDANAGDTLTYEKLDGPSWLTIALDGSVSGTPVNRHVGINQFMIAVSDSDGKTDRALLQITVNNVNDAPVFLNDPFSAHDAYAGQAYSESIADSATDVDAGDVLSFSILSGPTWLNIETNGTLYGTPGSGDQGTNSCQVQVSDGNGGSDTATLNILLNPPNAFPVFTSDPFSAHDAVLPCGYIGTITNSATDADGDGLMYTKLSGPDWLDIAAGGTLSGFPSMADIGTNSFTVQVFDGKNGTDTATMQIVVTDEIGVVLAGWDAGAGSATVRGAGVSSAAMTLHNGTGDGDASNKSGSSLTGKWGGDAALMPAPADTNTCTMMRANSATGTDMPYMDLTITAGSETLTLTAIVFDQYNYFGSYGKDILVYYQSGNLDDPDNTYLFTQAEVPGAAGNYASTELVGVNGLDIGSVLGDNVLAPSESATFRIYHGNASGGEMRYDNIAMLGTTTAAPGNSAPAFTSDPVVEVNATQGALYSSTLADDAFDVNYDTLFFFKTFGPEWLNVASNGVLSGTPSSTDLGLNSFTVQVDDGQGGSDTATLRITVTAPSTGTPELLVGWDAGAGGQTAAASGFTGTLTLNNGTGGGDASNKSGSSLTGKWGGDAGLSPSPVDTASSAMLRANGAAGTAMPYMDLLISNGGSGKIALDAIVFDCWLNWGDYNNDVTVYYQGGDLTGISNGTKVLTYTLMPSPDDNVGSTANPGVNRMDIGSALATNNILAAGGTATFRLYGGSAGGGELRFDNIAVLGMAAQTVRPFDGWRNAYFDAGELADPAISGPTATPMNDGIPNLVKYVLNLDPWNAGGIGPGWPEAADWIIGFDRNAAATDADFYLEMIHELASTQWLTIAMSVGGAGVTAQNGATVVLDSPGTTNGVQVSVPSTTNAFFRFRARQP